MHERLNELRWRATVSPFEIMAAKIWSMGLVVLAACICSLIVMAQGVLNIPIAGSIPLFLVGAALNIFATTALGILIGTTARSMQQFGIIMILILIPLQILSGGITARDSMPQLVQDLMMFAPTTHFVILAQAIFYRGAGLDVVWPQLLSLFAIGGGFFGTTLWYFAQGDDEDGLNCKSLTPHSAWNDTAPDYSPSGHFGPREERLWGIPNMVQVRKIGDHGMWAERLVPGVH